ncbi:hypothetical protein G6F68_012947 [Rhizopus microsporus]|nr:hypothetical protein G6F68_012947 [Rhizopus microsporus]
MRLQRPAHQLQVQLRIALRHMRQQWRHQHRAGPRAQADVDRPPVPGGQQCGAAAQFGRFEQDAPGAVGHGQA